MGHTATLPTVAKRKINISNLAICKRKTAQYMKNLHNSPRWMMVFKKLFLNEAGWVED
jgi:hypothetical protein